MCESVENEPAEEAPGLLILGQSPTDPPVEIIDIHVDHLGSTRVTTADSGSIITSHNFMPFGEEILALETPDPVRKMFTGHERDAGTGLDYMLARYYGNAFPRFLSPDPISGSTESPQSLNRYAYVGNKPLTVIDPTGMYGINPSPYNPGGNNPCDGRGPLCTVHITGETKQDKADGENEIADARANNPRFNKRYETLDAATGDYYIHFVRGKKNVTVDGYQPKHGKQKGQMTVDLADLEKVNRVGSGTHRLSKVGTLAKVLDESVFAANGVNHKTAHETGITFQNLVRRDLGLAPIERTEIAEYIRYVDSIGVHFEDGSSYSVPMHGGNILGITLYPTEMY